MHFSNNTITLNRDAFSCFYFDFNFSLLDLSNECDRRNNRTIKCHDSNDNIC